MRAGDEYKALVQAVASGPIAGVAFAIDLAAFNDVYPDTLRESAYMKCFARVVMETADNAARFNASNPTHQFSKIECTFDNRPEIEYSAARAYGAFIMILTGLQLRCWLQRFHLNAGLIRAFRSPI